MTSFATALAQLGDTGRALRRLERIADRHGEVDVFPIEQVQPPPIIHINLTVRVTNSEAIECRPPLQ